MSCQIKLAGLRLYQLNLYSQTNATRKIFGPQANVRYRRPYWAPSSLRPAPHKLPKRNAARVLQYVGVALRDMTSDQKRRTADGGIAGDILEGKASTTHPVAPAHPKGLLQLLLNSHEA